MSFLPRHPAAGDALIVCLIIRFTKFATLVPVLSSLVGRSRSCHGAAIDGVDAAVDIRRVRAAQEGDKRGDFFRFAGFNPQDPGAAHEKFLTRIPLARYGKAEEVAALVAFLCSADASYINGGIYTVDGGAMA